MDILFIGDVVGKPGRQAVRDYLQRHRDKWDIVLANGENAAGGRGITEDTVRELFQAGVDGMTMGNHVWDKKEAYGILEKERRIVRPGNYTSDLPGSGLMYLPAAQGRELAVINVSGRAFMDNLLECPFRKAQELVKKASSRTPYILVDFHGEATSEKLAFLNHLDGKAGCIVGTHTHVQTNDDRITEKGTAYITDTGMTGPVQSILGMKIEPCLQRFLLGVPVRIETAGGKAHICGLSVRLGDEGKALEAVKISETI